MNDQKEIIKRIEELVSDSFTSQNAFAIQVGINSSNFRKKLNGEQTITKNDIKKIADAKKVSREWLQTGKGEKYIERSDDEINNRLKEEIIVLARQLSYNQELILKTQRENDDIMRQLNALYIQLDK